ncbi:antirestriction protein ArdA [Paracoccus alkenifer]|uniref:Antirestriction protein n=1 Tax=Paracoccus alkenifer TaxID=65735 RepID=A0A1H6JJW0_9RHOB|nr:antirestriction protein ArdA [Paracoccus alkenifer]SEH60793.1 Antirestriction protein [Paracoccus alkenifer]
MKQSKGEIKIYVACLAAYNNGYLHGSWIDAHQDAYDLYAEIRAMLATSPVAEDAEEWAIHDYEGFEGARLSEYMGMEEVAELAAFIAEHGEVGGKLVEYFGNLNDARKAIAESYAGQYRSLADFAEELTEETGSVPDNLHYYIDYDRMARDLEINDVFVIQTSFEQVHVFWNH